jgi:signal transduction histidine kinase
LALAHENVTEIKRAQIAMQEFNVMLLNAQDEERRRVARDLHDSTAQDLAVIKGNIVHVQKLSSDMDSRAKDALAEVMFLCDQVIKELRTVSYLLHPPLLEEAGLVRAIRWYVQGFTLRSHIEVEVRVSDEVGRLQPDMETALFRVVQEGLTNIHRHSGSPRAVLSLFMEKGEVILRIQDQGRGIPELSPGTQTVIFPGVGIPGMRQRLNQLGGQLEIESNRYGTTVTARAPVLEERIASYSNCR